MRILVLIAAVFAVNGCATGPSLQELTNEAHLCVARQHDAAGIIAKATSEQSASCWVDVNNKVESIAKAEAKREEEAAGRCGKGLVSWCINDRCRCIRTYEARETLCRSYGIC